MEPPAFVRYRIALAFTDADRTRMLEQLGSARAAAITADFRPEASRARPGSATDSPAPPLYDAAAAEWLRAQVRAAVVGTQLVLAGPETDVLTARTDALALGMVSAEILLLSRPDPVRRVYCPHCRTTSRTQLQPGSTLTCCGCGRTLEIFAHFSRSLTAYLGVAAGIEPAHKQEGSR